MDNASSAAKVTKNGWLGKTSPSSFDCSYSSRGSSLAGVPPLFLSLTRLLYVGRKKQACSAEGWQAFLPLGTFCVFLHPTVLICSLPSSPKLVFPQNKHAAIAGYFCLEKRGQWGFEMPHLHSIVSSE